jgi:hypothetical protein
MLVARCLLAALGAGGAGVSAADGPGFATSNHQPLALIYGLPPIGDAQVLAPGRTRVGLSFGLANQFVGESAAGEKLLIDGETQRWNLSMRRGLMPGWEWGLDIPYLMHGGGFLDGLIEGFHDTFDMPQNGRDQIERGRLLFSYTRDGVERLHLSRAQSGLGDVRLTGATALAESLPVAARASLKLPSGNADSLTGSGAADLALWVTAACPLAARGVDSWCGYGGAGVLLMGAGDVLADWQRSRVPFGSAGVAWRYDAVTTIKLQLDAHGPLYRSALPPLGESAAQFSFGVTWGADQALQWDIAFAEDIVVNSAPDMTLLISVHAPF